MSQLPPVPMASALTLHQRFTLVEIAAAYNRTEAGKEALKLLREIGLAFNPVTPLHADDPYPFPLGFGDSQMAFAEGAYHADVVKPPV